MTEPNELGNRLVFFNLNGQTRPIEVKDKSLESKVAVHQKAVSKNMKMESTITSPQAGVVVKIHLKEKTLVEQDDMIVELGK